LLNGLDPAQIRAESKSQLSQLGFPALPSHYPILFEPDETPRVRPADKIAARAAALNVVVNRGLRMPSALAVQWVESNDLRSQFTASEWEMVLGRRDAAAFTTRIEALWALAWCMGLGDHIDPRRYCGDGLAAALPDLRRSERFSDWTARAPIREPQFGPVLRALDLYFCLHWAVAEAALRHQRSPGVVEGYVIEERRRGLEWVVIMTGENGAEDWDSIDLST
jgi:hypothetical protein